MAEEAGRATPKRRRRCQENLPMGVGFRPNSDRPYFETRFSAGVDFKLFTSTIKSVTEGGMMYDISKLYEWLLKSLDGVGNEESSTLELNFPEYSRTLQLELLPSDLIELKYSNLASDEKKGIYKKTLMEMVQRQARVAARNYERSQGFGAQGTNPQSLPYLGAPVTPPPVPRSTVTLPSVCRGHELQAILDKISELKNVFRIACGSKVAERENLEQKLKCLNESRGKVSRPETITPDILDSSILHFARNELSSMCEKFMSEDSTCDLLRKELKEAEFECVTDSLMTDQNQQIGRLREEEPRLIPEIQEKDLQCSTGHGYGSRASVSSYGRSYTPPASMIDIFWPLE